MNSEKLNYLITEDKNVLIGAPSDVDWTGAKGELVGLCLHIKKDKELFFIDSLDSYKDLIELIKKNNEIVLSYVNDEGPQFISVPVVIK